MRVHVCLGPWTVGSVTSLKLLNAALFFVPMPAFSGTSFDEPPFSRMEFAFCQLLPEKLRCSTFSFWRACAAFGGVEWSTAMLNTPELLNFYLLKRVRKLGTFKSTWTILLTCCRYRPVSYASWFLNCGFLFVCVVIRNHNFFFNVPTEMLVRLLVNFFKDCNFHVLEIFEKVCGVAQWWGLHFVRSGPRVDSRGRSVSRIWQHRRRTPYIANYHINNDNCFNNFNYN